MKRTWMMAVLAVAVLVAGVAPAWSASDTYEQIDAKLRSTKLNSVKIEGSYSEVFAFLSEASGVNFVLSDALTADDGAEPVKLHLPNAMTVLDVMRVVFKLYDLECYIQDGVCLVTGSKEAVIDPVLRVYNVSTLQFKPTDFAGPEMKLSSSDEGGFGTGDIDYGVEPAEPLTADELAELVQKFCGGTSWDDNENVKIEVKGGMLFVLQTPAVHDQIAQLLQLLEGAK